MSGNFKTQCRVKVWNAGAYIKTFADIRPSGGTAYTYETAAEAWQACEKANDGSRCRDDYRVIDISNNKEV